MVGEDQQPPVWITVFVAPPEALTGAMGDDPARDIQGNLLGVSQTA